MENETLFLSTADGCSIETDVHPGVGRGAGSAPRAAVAIAHPHPLHGGDRRHPVVATLAGRLAAEGCVAATFDFRGVHRSTGRHDHGRGELLDLRAVLEELRRRAPDRPLIAAGYSFGAMIALELDDPSLAGWVAVAPPLGSGDPAAAFDDRPKLLVSPTHDQFCSFTRATELTESWHTTDLREIAMSDHFLTGRAEYVADQVVEFVRRLAGP